jgi:polyhydroxyalkanoate synthesis repressor PhaR
MPAKRAKADAAAGDDVVIKKYANRRLYNTSTSSYVTLDDLRKMVQQDINFRVIDAKSGDDLTRAVLTQIIVEEESSGKNLLPISFLRQIISMYEDNMRWTLPQYLETAMGWYGTNQKELQSQFNNPLKGSLGGMVPPGAEEMKRTQMAMFERTLQMFNPLAAVAGGKVSPEPPPQQQPPQEPSPEERASPGNGKDDGDISGLRDQIAALQEAVASLARKG